VANAIALVVLRRASPSGDFFVQCFSRTPGSQCLRGHAAVATGIPDTMSDDADQTLMTVVNALGVTIFTLIVAYHFVTSTTKDAE
jgi:hypothetical protein